MIKSFRGVLVFIIFFLGSKVEAQNDFFFSHYMFNSGYFNPSFISSNEESFLSFNHRIQWAGYDPTSDVGRAPFTQMASFVVPSKGKVKGLGVYVVNDRLGNLSAFQMRFGIALKKATSFGEVRLGIMPSFNVMSVNTEYYRFQDLGDEFIPQASESQVKPNLHVGVLFQFDNNHFLSGSIENVITPRFSFGTTADNVVKRNYKLYGGTEIILSNKITLKPFILGRTDLITYSYEVSAIMEYYKNIWTGVSYKDSESINLLFGYSFLKEKKINIGYSFELIVGNMKTKKPTSHEVFLRYNLPDLIVASKKAVKTPRFYF